MLRVLFCLFANIFGQLASFLLKQTRVNLFNGRLDHIKEKLVNKNLLIACQNYYFRMHYPFFWVIVMLMKVFKYFFILNDLIKILVI